jgi:CTD nuclear envelope phosphatase 1
VTNEEGLPIHEIRENPDGTTIGPLPPSTTDSTFDTVEETDDYWSDVAKARREALRKRVFNEDTDTENEEDDYDIASSSFLAAKALPTPPPETGPPLETSTPSSPPITSPPKSCRPSFTTRPGKSILKLPSRKKSVSFDESVALPPDSPDGPRTRTTMGFPVPSTEPNEFEPRPVPVIHPPRLPSSKEKESDLGFAGFKRGFLETSKPPPPRPNETVKEEQSGARKPSLFAQRLAQQAVKESSPPPTLASTDNPLPPTPKASNPPGVSLPKLSESKPMASMKSSVVEKPPHVLSKSSSAPARQVEEGLDPEAGEDDGDEDSMDISDEDDEDEYDLDDALLAREVALEYHRRHTYSRLNTDPDAPTMSIEREGEDGDTGGVMLALPRVDASGRPMIVNPTADDVQRFVRVGRLENGNLVLAPGERGWSDEDVGDDEREIRRQRKEDVKRQLLGEIPVGSSSRPEEKGREEDVGLPPKLVTDKVEPALREVREVEPRVDEVEQPKKISRFKQARMVAGQ